jgi:hypothetical protein
VVDNEVEDNNDSDILGELDGLSPAGDINAALPRLSAAAAGMTVKVAVSVLVLSRM